METAGEKGDGKDRGMWKKALTENFSEERRGCMILKDADSGASFSVEEFSAKVNALARVLQNKTADEIIVCSDNGIWMPFLFYSALCAGKVIIPVDPEKKNEEIQRIRQLHKGALFFSQEDACDLFHGTSGIDHWEPIPWDSVDFVKPWLITYTSGSTGEPKGVIHSAKNLFFTAWEFGKTMGYDTHTVMAHCMPMSYMAGILNTIILPQLMGGEVVVFPRFSMQSAFAFWRNVRDNNCNTLWLSPTMLRILSVLDKNAEMKEYFKEQDMKISVGTAPLDSSLREDFEKKYEHRIYQSYGLSETLFLTTELPEEPVSEHTVGKPLPSVRLELSEDGEVRIGTPWMFYGYTNTDTAEYFRENEYFSGDLGRFLPSGNFLITGRKKELIVRGGYNINPRDIEGLMIDQGAAAECAVFPAVRHGEEQIACVYVRKGTAGESDLNRMIMEKLGKHYRVDLFYQVRELPKNLNGKPDKPKMRRMLEKDENH